MLDEFGKFYKPYLKKLAEPACYTDAKQLAESLSLLAYHLYRFRPSGVWLNCSNQNRTPTTRLLRESKFQSFRWRFMLFCDTRVKVQIMRT